ncbi:MAG: Tol-Pal system beta propeller repeat protein TolB [Nitrospina sp.]|jgi:TolB protein|nr:Tol-Pal system beta propeller repeat protein TolB [Nitrospina sp.]MBT3509091.1 Tol-Pal system beta propeller repeat protein TolB [Nitrospina sp.]MBT3876727.1 Tol-Pal system beta propeller repeat protein TolB [Nitrospina sp.]MBT4047854.1 Tol-Pal system beta propeller repeat protein TolB [Nitrospina sp.]MBT4558585.1 Tol-Pal system beta propeller repeat protein TolB [Nitrospina sp.]
MFPKTSKFSFYSSLILMVLVLLQAGTALAESRARIDLERETRKKVTIAITDFVLKGSMEDFMGIGKETKKILEKDLMLSEWFSLLRKPAFQELENMEPSTSVIDYRSWRQVGAQWLIKTEYSVLKNGKGQVFTFRLYDAVNKRFLLGKRYKASSDLLRTTLHRFADEVVMQLTGKRGIAETQIAFLSQENAGKEIYLIDFDGYNLRRLTHDRTLNLSPAWSPDGKWIIYTSYAARNPDLIMIDTSGKRRQTLHRLPGLNAAPSWSPDMQKIALVLSRDQNSEVYILNKDHQLKRLTRHFNIDTSPTWSPDGKKIAFTSDRSGTGSPQIYIMDSEKGDQSKVTRISFGSAYNDNPAWSPNGDQIAYTSRVGKRFKISIYDLNTHKSRVVTTGSGSYEQPSWSPDGRFIIYRGRENDRFDLFIQKVGSNVARQLTFSGKGHSPAWSSYFKH